MINDRRSCQLSLVCLHPVTIYFFIFKYFVDRTFHDAKQNNNRNTDTTELSHFPRLSQKISESLGEGGRKPIKILRSFRSLRPNRTKYTQYPLRMNAEQKPTTPHCKPDTVPIHNNNQSSDCHKISHKYYFIFREIQKSVSCQLSVISAEFLIYI